MVPTFTPGKFRFGGAQTSLPCVVRLSIGLRRFDPKGGLSREDQKILVSAHQHIRSAGIGQSNSFQSIAMALTLLEILRGPNYYAMSYPNYSYLSATIGSTRTARRAGI